MANPLCLALLAAILPLAQNEGTRETRYLAFQVFTGSSERTSVQALGPMPSERSLDDFAKDLTARIGTVGQKGRRLAIIFGPLAFDNSDADVRQLIDQAFTIALKHNVAVGFHIDDSMFWTRRKDLWRNPENVEWRDWKGTPSTGRRIDWSSVPEKLPPQMCFNSRRIEDEVLRRGALIGSAIQAGRKRLRQQGTPELFAGVIVGWETMIGQEFDTGGDLGYHALYNRGYRKNRPPADMDAEREKIVNDFIDLWCKSLRNTGVTKERLYSQVAVLPRVVFDGMESKSKSYSELAHFAPPSVAFCTNCRPGFSMYPQPGLFEDIYDAMARHGHPAWASSEGTNLRLGWGPGQSGMNMETYLAKMFNHGAALVNIFSWGMGGEANKNMPFRVVTEGPDALAAYRKFLRGQQLVETASPSKPATEDLPGKIHRIQANLPAWVRRTGRQAEVEPLMRRLDAAIKAQDFNEADQIADQILRMISLS